MRVCVCARVYLVGSGECGEECLSAYHTTQHTTHSTQSTQSTQSTTTKKSTKSIKFDDSDLESDIESGPEDDETQKVAKGKDGEKNQNQKVARSKVADTGGDSDTYEDSEDSDSIESISSSSDESGDDEYTKFQKRKMKAKGVSKLEEKRLGGIDLDALEKNNKERRMKMKQNSPTQVSLASSTYLQKFV